MKKIILTSALLGFLTLPLLVGALTPAPQDPSATSFPQMIDNISRWLLGLLLAVAVIFLIIAGYYFVTARGDPDKVKTARDFVLYAFIGVVVGLAAYALITFAGTILG